MGSHMTPIPPVQMHQLSEQQRWSLLYEVFEILEYGRDGEPGAEWSTDIEILANLSEVFGRYGVTLTDPNDLPFGYRFNEHNDTAGNRCKWAGTLTQEPMQRRTQGGIQCPDACPDSVIETDPDAPSIEDRGSRTFIAASCVVSGRPMVQVNGTWEYALGHRPGVDDQPHNCEPAPGTVAWSSVWTADAASTLQLGMWHIDHPTT